MRPRKQNLGRISQGDIYRDVEFVEYVAEKEGNLEISRIVFPLVVVLTQDCDLAQDFKFRYGRPRPATHDKLLLSVLVAPLYNVEHVYEGEHLSELKIRMEPLRKRRSEGTLLRTNRNRRFHYVQFPDDVPIVPSVIDFKHYFSVNVTYLKKAKRDDFVCRIPPLYMVDLSHRYASFLSRVALPSAE